IRDLIVTGVQTCALPIFGATQPVAAGDERADAAELRQVRVRQGVLEDHGVRASRRGGGRVAEDFDVPHANRGEVFQSGLHLGRQIGRASCRERWWGGGGV